jgi:threonine/homoserine/homoserine lactone efflux protein
MLLSDIFIPKGNGLGWTLDFSNPKSWVFLMGIVGLVVLIKLKGIKELLLLAKAFFTSKKK